MGPFKILKFRSFNGQYTVQNYWDGVLGDEASFLKPRAQPFTYLPTLTQKLASAKMAKTTANKAC